MSEKGCEWAQLVGPSRSFFAYFERRLSIPTATQPLRQLTCTNAYLHCNPANIRQRQPVSVGSHGGEKSDGNKQTQRCVCTRQMATQYPFMDDALGERATRGGSLKTFCGEHTTWPQSIQCQCVYVFMSSLALPITQCLAT
mgnify:CR=1 FL=1